MNIGAERMCMPSPSIDQFIDAVKQTTLPITVGVPLPGKGSLCIRPLLMGSRPILGRFGSSELVENEYHRATPGGTGSVKTISNYAPFLKALNRAKSRGFSDVPYLDSVDKRNLEEVSSCNIFIVKDKVISTPATYGTILEGITRKSIIQIAHDYGFQVEERTTPVDELLDADEVFCTGTAVVIAPVGSIIYRDRRIGYNTDAGSVCRVLYSTLVGIQTGTIEDKNGWTVESH